MISILCPTRNRTDAMRRLVTSARQTASNPVDVEFIFYVDDDDDASANVADDLGATTVRGSRIVLSEMWNRCWDEAKYDVAMHCGDDIIFRSQQWDLHVLYAFERYPDKIALVHGRDGYQDAGLATHGFMHRNWVNALGYFVPPHFSSDMNDLWNTEIADAVNRRVFLPEVYTEHMHPVVGKGTWDQTHQERLARHTRDNVEQLYRDLLPRRLEDIAKLRAAIQAGGSVDS
jgi:glycosyltransferase involved in cell wall biosynthesis